MKKQSNIAQIRIAIKNLKNEVQFLNKRISALEESLEGFDPNEDIFITLQGMIDYICAEEGLEFIDFTRNDLKKICPEIGLYGLIPEFIEQAEGEAINKVGNKHKQSRYSQYLIFDQKIKITRNKIGRVYRFFTKSP